jgi:iron complex outermembrane receptor protein
MCIRDSINPWQAMTSKKHLIVKSETGSYGTYSNQLTAAINSPEGTSWLTASQLHTDGYRSNSRYNRYNITLKGRYQIRQHYWHYLYNFRHLYGQIPSSLDSIDFRNSPEKAADSWAAIKGYEASNRHILNVGLNSALSNQTTNAINVFGSTSDLDELRPFNRLEEAKKSVGLREKLSYQTLKLKIETGVEFMTETNDVKLFGVKEANWGEPLSRTQLQRSYLNAFSMAEYKVHPKLLIQVAFNLNSTQYQSEPKSSSDNKIRHHYPLTFSPHLGVNYQLNAASNFYASAGHGFSAPSLEEAQLPDGNFNPDIKPEEGYHFDLGYRFLSVNTNTRMELTAYWMKMTNLLVTKRESEEQFYGVNAGRTIHRGIEASIQHILPLSNSNQIQFSSSYSQSVNRFADFVDDGNDYSDKHLPGIPAFNLYLSANGKFGKQNIHINYRMNGKQYLNDNNTNRYEAFNVLNAKFNRTIKLGSITGDIYIGANNLLNTHFASMVLVNAPSFGNSLPRYYYPALPFNVYLGINISL